jgi:hypothetical protein
MDKITNDEQERSSCNDALASFIRTNFQTDLRIAAKLVDLVQRRVERPQLWEAMGTKWWFQGKHGRPCWKSSSLHFRSSEPRFYCRRFWLFREKGLARFHYAEGDYGLRRISLIFGPMDDKAAAALSEAVTTAFALSGDKRVGASIEAHSIPWGTELVVDLTKCNDA